MAYRLSTLLHLKLQDDDEFCSIVPTAENFEAVDTAIAADRARLSAIETPTVTAAATLTTIETGNTYQTILGKVKTLITQFLNHIGAGGNAHSAATTASAGFLSSTDKTKLDGIEAQANKYTHPSHTAKSSGLYKITVDASGHVSGATPVQKSDITAFGISESAAEANICQEVFKGIVSQGSIVTEGLRVGNVIVGYGKFIGSLTHGETAQFKWVPLAGWKAKCVVPVTRDSNITVSNPDVVGGSVCATLINTGAGDKDGRDVPFIVVLTQED